MSYVILIPAYKPAEELLALLDKLSSAGAAPVVVIDDGSGPEFFSIFQQVKIKSGCHLVVHAINQGKGRALKTGINFILSTWPDVEGVITADADGQHVFEDIMAIEEEMARSPRCFVLGCRKFTDPVPLRSRIGNRVTCWVFRLLVGVKVSDTQTGLRGIPRAFLPDSIVLSGERYEYEINMLVHLVRERAKVVEVPIQTVYIDENISSHFSPVFDSFKIYFVLLRFFLSSVSTSLIDYFIFMGTLTFTGSIGWATICARIFAGSYNYGVNRKFVFKETGRGFFLFVKYWLLVLILSSFSFLGIRWLTDVSGFPVGVAKVLVETVLFSASFVLQRDVIFNRGTANESTD